MHSSAVHIFTSTSLDTVAPSFFILAIVAGLTLANLFNGISKPVKKIGEFTGDKISEYNEKVEQNRIEREKRKKEFNPDVDLGEVKNEVHGIVGELIEHGIVPTDPHFENFLVTFDETEKRKLNMVDVDDNYVSIYPDGKRDFFYQSEVSTCYRVIDLSIDDVNSKRNGSIHN